MNFFLLLLKWPHNSGTASGALLGLMLPLVFGALVPEAAARICLADRKWFS